ncbi:MAG TPA: prepilin-type N-terminal cleavage/methylation domain-containing protein [Humidesulfovibrio sp.]|uniref:prepilin-type N-terminal cleavage/methylation domain-containing protein n=1 Tax=Humidesulfovibrio sp. TaxID=2910988 RepID=UPI002BC2B6E0|nr:prepilin-type N-terminal cleavage/methylation domain-containing protein [Humidesulfovibrio sp.]HWR02517.1 prepilin-type N-terminal cleavage/methylation domain-containing protein [Humidesulfovibrio sp.]
MQAQNAHKPDRARGFTLVEVIVIIVVAGFLGVVVVNLMGTQLMRSGTPLMTAKGAAQAEATMETITAYFSQRVNSGTSGALDAVAARYPSNATLTMTRNANFEGVDALTVTVTESGVSLTTVLTQVRTSSADNSVNY